MLKTSLQGCVLSIGVLFLVGCGTGEIVPLDLRAIEPPAVPIRDRVKVAITTFEDARSETGVGVEQARIGLRTHLAGGETYFVVNGGKLGPAVSKVMADYLTKRGLEAWVATPADSRTPDIRIDGRVREYRSTAKSHFGWTELVVLTKVDVDAINLADQSTVRMTLNGQKQDVKVVFDTRDLERLMNEALDDSFKEFLKDTRIADRRMGFK